MFLEINGTWTNFCVVGEIIYKPSSYTICYSFEGGRIEQEVFSTEAEYNAKVQEIANLGGTT